MRSKELSVEVRDRIVLRHRSGDGYQTMSAALKVPKNTVASFLNVRRLEPPRLFLELDKYSDNLVGTQFNLGSNQVVETSRMINGNRMPLCSISSLIAKGLNISVNNVFLFYIF